MERGCKIMGTSIKSELEKRHKIKPVQFTSFAAGVAKRVSDNLKFRKSYRLTVHDERRKFSSPSPAPSPEPKKLTDVELKSQSRRAQLLKWKEEKDKQRKATAGKKIKPFLAGVYRAPMKFEFPPPVKTFQVLLGRTRSQTAAAKTQFVFNSKSREVKKPLKEPLNNKEGHKKLSNKPVSQSNLLENKKVNDKKTKNENGKNKLVSEDKPKKTAVNKKVQGTDKSVKENVTKKVEAKIPLDKKKAVKVVITQSSGSDTDSNVVPTKLQKSSVTKLKEVKKVKDNKKTTNKSNPKIATPSKKGLVVESKVISVNVIKPLTTQSSTESETCDTENDVNGKTPQRIPRSESHIEDRLRSPKSPEAEVELQPSHLSPHITMSRGKENIRRENKQKIKDGLLAEDSSDGQTVEHYRRQLATEIARMTAMCDQWDTMQKQLLPDCVQEQILAAVGLGRLLMGQKLQQFAGLVEKCAHPEPGTPLVTATDLRGFWDLVFIQIEDVDLKFKKLQELRDRNWEELKPVQVKPAVKKMAAKKAVKPAAPSRIREMIAAARKAQKSSEHQIEESDNKTFEAGFFTIQSPVRSPLHTSVTGTPRNKYSLLKEVVSSEAKKASANKSSYAMMRASLISKGAEIEGVEPLQFTPLKPLPDIDLDATPARSILKSAKKSVKKSKKSIKSVLFTDNEEISEGKTDILTTDSGLSSMEHDEKVEKENKLPKSSKKNKKIHRQDAVENDSPVARNLRSRKSTEEIKLSKSKSEENITNIKVSGKSSRKKKSLSEINEENNETPKPRRSSRRHSVKI